LSDNWLRLIFNVFLKQYRQVKKALNEDI